MNNELQVIQLLIDITKIQKGQIENLLEVVVNLKKRIEILEKRSNTITFYGSFRNDEK